MSAQRIIRCGILCGAFCLATSLAACERSVEETKTTQTPDGTKTEKKTVTDHDNGTVTKTDVQTETH